MIERTTPSLLLFYGIFLILCGITSVLFIGSRAKTALISGGISGVISLTIAYLLSTGVGEVRIAGIILTFALFIVFAWRSTKTLFKVFELIPSSHPDLKGKGIAFLIIGLMAIVSLFTLVLQLISL